MMVPQKVTSNPGSAYYSPQGSPEISWTR